MPSDSVDSIDRTVHETNAWLAELSTELGIEDRADAWRIHGPTFRCCAAG
jgi:uncharacterized protein (DUF2267 family)